MSELACENFPRTKLPYFLTFGKISAWIIHFDLFRRNFPAGKMYILLCVLNIQRIHLSTGDLYGRIRHIINRTWGSIIGRHVDLRQWRSTRKRRRKFYIRKLFYFNQCMNTVVNIAKTMRKVAIFSSLSWKIQVFLLECVKIGFYRDKSHRESVGANIREGSKAEGEICNFRLCTGKIGSWHICV